MDLKQALIVDDSKSAQHVLSRMLEKFDLRTDAAFSAEEALAYLSHHHPTVIFLDENMPGMNGIEALKTIKSNPNTALIPVIMYTSADDDVFVTQARALGALDILSKSNMQPESLARVLTSLKIFPVATNTQLDTDENDAKITHISALNVAVQKPKTVEVALTTEMTDLEQVSKQISRLFEIHITAVREQINNSAQFVTKRVLFNLEKNLNGLSGQRNRIDSQISSPALEPEIIVDKQADLVKKQKYSYLTQALLSALLLSALWIGYQLFRISSDLETNSASKLAVSDTVTKQDAQHIASAVVQLIDDKNNLTDGIKGITNNSPNLKAMVWMQNTDFQFNFNEQPLNDAQIINLASLTRLLADAGYTGTVTVNINFGNFCLEAVTVNNISNWRLAGNNLMASECKQLKDVNPKFSAADYATPAFRNFERNLSSQHDGRITVRLASNGISQPRVDYPLITSSITADEWNNAAARNNRLSIQLNN